MRVRLLPFALSLAILSLPAFADQARPEAKEYAAVDAALSKTLADIRKDFLKLAETGKFPQLKGMEDSEIEVVDDRGNHHWLLHRLDNAPVEGEPRSEGAVVLDLEFITYDTTSDPRYGSGAAAARPVPHFQTKGSRVPFGLRASVAAGDAGDGKAFVEAANALINTRLEAVKKELGAEPVTWTDLLEQAPREAVDLEKSAYMIVEGKVVGHSKKTYEKTGQPERIEVKVTKVLGGRLDYKNHAQVDSVISIDPYHLKPAVDMPIGANIKAYLDLGFVQHAVGVLSPFFYPAGPDGIKVIGKAEPAGAATPSAEVKE